MDLKKLAQHEPFKIIPTGIGEVGVFSISVKGSIGFSKQQNDDNKYCSDIEFAKNFFPFIIWPKSSFVEGKFKPSEPLFSSNDIEILNDTERELIAEIFLNNSEYLYRRQESVSEKGSDNVTRVHFEFKEVTRPRNHNETNVAYLQRIYREHEKEQMKMFRDNIKSILPGFHLSDAINRDLYSTNALGENLKNMFKPIYPGFKSLMSDSLLSIPSKIEHTPSIPSFSSSPLASLPKNFKGLSEKLDELIGISAQTTEYIVEMNKIQNQVLSELTQSGQSSLLLAAKSIKINLLVLLISLSSVFIAIYSACTTSRENHILHQQNADHQKKLLTTLDNIN